MYKSIDQFRQFSPTLKCQVTSEKSLCMMKSGPHGGRRVARAGIMVPRPLLYVKKYVDLDQYVADHKARRIATYAFLPREKRIELFGSTIVPIHVPLARGETADQYEERFVQWLEKKRLTLRELETSDNDALERMYRFQFANQNAIGVEAFVTRTSNKRVRQTSCDSPRKKRPAEDREEIKSKSDELREPTPGEEVYCVRRPVGESSTVKVADAFTACGCEQCLVDTVRFLASKIIQLDDRIS